MSVRIMWGDCRAVMASLPEGSVDSIVTDPPYELGFMGKGWDSTGVANDIETWRAALRVLKPGGHLLAFSGTRTYHRMVCSIEDAGFEIRDQIGWVYGSGFPKSLDVSKAIDKAAGAEREVVGYDATRARPNRTGAVMGDTEYDRSDNGATQTAAATDAARQWQGWGTALKPSQEPVVIAQKPYANSDEWVAIGRSIIGLWTDLWSLVLANDAVPVLGLSPHDSGADLSAFVRWSADRRFSTRAALSDQMGTSRFVPALISSLNTVKSWSASLAASSQRASMSTTETESRRTTDLKTLRFCLSRITPESITLAHRSGQWLSADACNAARYSSATVATLSATLELSAVESAIAKEQASCRGVGASLNRRPIVLARKPLGKGLTVASNVLAHGTGGLNIDGCRVPGQKPDTTRGASARGTSLEGGALAAQGRILDDGLGRWPANIIHDGSDEVLAAFPQAPGQMADASNSDTPRAGENVYGAMKRVNGREGEASADSANEGAVGFKMRPGARRLDEGSAARFFYCAKADSGDRHDGLAHPGPQFISGSTLRDAETIGRQQKGNHHPTVKPTALMRYLCRLVTPPGGVVLDPFMGSGSTLKAAELEGFSAIGIELDPAYIEIARRRIASDAPLFAEVEVTA